MPIKEKPNVFGMPTKKVEHTELAPGKTQIMELRKLLLDESATPVVQKLIQIALDDDHSGQMAAIKMVTDRILPMSEFEKIGGGSKPTVTINISGINEEKLVIEGENDK